MTDIEDETVRYLLGTIETSIPILYKFIFEAHFITQFFSKDYLPEHDGKIAAPKNSKNHRKITKGQNELHITRTIAHVIARIPKIHSLSNL